MSPLALPSTNGLPSDPRLLVMVLWALMGLVLLLMSLVLINGTRPLKLTYTGTTRIPDWRINLARNRWRWWSVGFAVQAALFAVSMFIAYEWNIAQERADAVELARMMGFVGTAVFIMGAGLCFMQHNRPSAW